MGFYEYTCLTCGNEWRAGWSRSCLKCSGANMTKWPTKKEDPDAEYERSLTKALEKEAKLDRVVWREDE